MSMSSEDDSINRKEPEPQRLPYHAPRLVSLGSVQSLVQGVAAIGSDGAPTNDCAFF
jgi:hypothetical protein